MKFTLSSNEQSLLRSITREWAIQYWGSVRDEQYRMARELAHAWGVDINGMQNAIDDNSAILLSEAEHDALWEKVTGEKVIPEVKTEKMEFAIEFKRVSYVTVYVAAECKDQAETLGWAEIDRGYARGNDAEWSLQSIEKVDVYASKDSLEGM